MSDLTTLYRFYDADNRLLYIGISARALHRFNQHRRRKEWFTELDHSTMQHFDTREKALAAEKRAIKDERPLYNVVHNTRRFTTVKASDIKPTPNPKSEPPEGWWTCDTCKRQVDLYANGNQARVWVYVIEPFVIEDYGKWWFTCSETCARRNEPIAPGRPLKRTWVPASDVCTPGQAARIIKWFEKCHNENPEMWPFYWTSELVDLLDRKSHHDYSSLIGTKAAS